MSLTRTARIAFLAPTLLIVALVTASAYARTAAVSHATQLKIESLDTPVIKASSAWTRAIAALPSSASSSQLDAALSKDSPAYGAALKTFDAGIAKLMLPAGADVAGIVKEDKQFESLLANTHVSTSTFESQFRAIFAADMTLATKFKSATGLTADSSLVV